MNVSGNSGDTILNYLVVNMKTINYFDYQIVAREMQIPVSILKKIEKEVKAEFPKDKMMYELHVLRAIKSKYWEKTPA